MSDPIQSIARHLGIQTFGDGLLAKIGQTIDLLQEAARNRADLAAECERLRAANDRLHAMVNRVVAEGILIADERDAALAELAALKGEQEPNWRDHSVNIAKGEKCPQTIETLQAAWDRDQELLLEQRAEIAKLKEKLNQARQKQSSQASAWVPEGWKLVPVEPTEAMLNSDCVSCPCGHQFSPNLFDHIYGRMLAAAPTPGASDGKGGE